MKITHVFPDGTRTPDIRMAADKDYSGPKYAPPLTRHQEEVWSRMNDEIGRMIGGYIKSLPK